MVTDGAGDPVPDALLEIWQADADGHVPTAAGSLHRDGCTFTGWGRAATDDEGRYTFSTVRPGATDPAAAPFIAVTVFARGLLDRLFTRIYLPGDRPRRRPAAGRAARRPPPNAHRDARRSRVCASTSRCRATEETVFLRYPGHRPVSDLFWPGITSPARLLTDARFLRAMLAVE